MKKNMQTFINICFFISIIVLIYQTDGKQDKIDLTKFDQIELKLRDIEKINNLQGETFESWQSLLNKKSSEIFDNQENLKLTEKNVLILFDDRNRHRQAINENIEVTKLNSKRIQALAEYIEK
jgi:hypothetical protein